MQTLATILLMFVLAAPFQRIETQYPDRAKVTRVETAMNHLTIIELAEPVTLAAAGSPSASCSQSPKALHRRKRRERSLESFPTCLIVHRERR